MESRPRKKVEYRSRTGINCTASSSPRSTAITQPPHAAPGAPAKNVGRYVDRSLSGLSGPLPQQSTVGLIMRVLLLLAFVGPCMIGSAEAGQVRPYGDAGARRTAEAPDVQV